MKFSNIIKLLLTCLFVTPLASGDIIKFMDECSSHCKKTHTKFGNINDSEVNPTKVKHTAEDIGLTACLQRCRLAEIIRPKTTVEIGKI